MNPAAGSPAGGLHVDLGSGDRKGLRTQTHQSVVVTKQGKTHSYTVDGGVSDGVFLGIGHVNGYPKMHYTGIPRHTQSMIANKFLTEYFWKFQ